MSWPQLSTSLLLSLTALAFAVWVWRRAQFAERVPFRRAFALVVAGAGFALFCTLIERWALGISGIQQRHDCPVGKHRC